MRKLYVYVWDNASKHYETFKKPVTAPQAGEDPEVPNMCGPMYDGYRYILPNGEMIPEFELKFMDKEKAAHIETTCEKIQVVRYESWDTYNLLSMD